mgnify:CR=1 FL=1
MKISELPQEIKELALLRQKERANGLITDSIANAFVWSITKEGHEYWRELDSKEAEIIEPKKYDNVISIIETKNYDDVIAIIEKKIATMSSRGFESYYLPIGILKDLIREIKEIK